jgi:hypothetical protein
MALLHLCVNRVVRLSAVRRLFVVAMLAAATVGAVGPVDASQERADSPQQPPLLRLLRESRAPYHTVATRFLQQKRLSILDVTLKSEGMIFFRRPGAVRYEIISPARSVLLYDGKKVRYYTFSEGRWKLLNSPAATAIGQVLRQIGHWIQGDFDAGRKMFDVGVVPSEDGGGCIRMTPRSDALAEYIQRIEIYVAKAPAYRVTRVIIRESDVDVTELQLCQELRNRPIPKGTFLSPDASVACQSLFQQEENSDPNEAERPEP